MNLEPVVEVESLRTCLGGHWVHDDISFTLRTGEIVALIGGSGTDFRPHPASATTATAGRRIRAALIARPL